jgi:hypothetical protein
MTKNDVIRTVRETLRRQSIKEQPINFLKVHPATELWWQQRDLCARCAHCKRDDTAMRCMVTKSAHSTPWMRAAGSDQRYCIDARLLGAPCGPQAMLFTPRVGFTPMGTD